MSTGVVKFWNPSRWGIITPSGVKRGDRSREVFFHEAHLVEAADPREGAEVEYSINPDFVPQPGEGPRALTVKLLTKRGYVPISEGRKEKTYGAAGD